MDVRAEAASAALRTSDTSKWQETRCVSQSLSFNYQRKLFLLQETDETRALAGQRVTVFELDDGSIQMFIHMLTHFCMVRRATFRSEHSAFALLRGWTRCRLRSEHDSMEGQIAR